MSVCLQAYFHDMDNTEGYTKQHNYLVTKADARIFSLELPLLTGSLKYLHFGGYYVFGGPTQIIISLLCIFLTFYCSEYSLDPIMEIQLLSYACNLLVFNKLHDIPSRKTLALNN